jgi:hypothetical protein
MNKKILEMRAINYEKINKLDKALKDYRVINNYKEFDEKIKNLENNTLNKEKYNKILV